MTSPKVYPAYYYYYYYYYYYPYPSKVEGCLKSQKF